jgi:hypothetical protein
MSSRIFVSSGVVMDYYVDHRLTASRRLEAKGSSCHVGGGGVPIVFQPFPCLIQNMHSKILKKMTGQPPPYIASLLTVANLLLEDFYRVVYYLEKSSIARE